MCLSIGRPVSLALNECLKSATDIGDGAGEGWLGASVLSAEKAIHDEGGSQKNWAVLG